MKKLSVVIAVLLLLSFLPGIIGCGQPTPTPPTPPVEEEEEFEQKLMAIFEPSV